MVSVDLRNVVSFAFEIKISVNVIVLGVYILSKHRIYRGDIVIIWVAASLSFSDVHVWLWSGLP
jgi:hypothetical protein